MAKKEKIDFTKLKLEELAQILVDRKHDLFNARQSLVNNDLADSNRIKQYKKDIARINTAINLSLINQAEEK